MIDTTTSKLDRDALRKHLRAQRAQLSLAQVQSNSALICQQLQLLTKDKCHIAGYLALGAEVDLTQLASQIRETDNHYYVPVVLQNHQMKFARLTDSTPMATNQYGINEPDVPSSSLMPGMQLDVVLVPLVGFDEQCNRMGMGGGYYDRCFEHRMGHNPPPWLIGVAHECQCVDTVLADSWDVPLDYIVTESRTISNTAISTQK